MPCKASSPDSSQKSQAPHLPRRLAPSHALACHHPSPFVFSPRLATHLPPAQVPLLFDLSPLPPLQLLHGNQYYQQFSTNPVEARRIQNIIEPDLLNKIKHELAWMPAESLPGDKTIGGIVEEKLLYSGKM